MKSSRSPARRTRLAHGVAIGLAAAALGLAIATLGTTDAAAAGDARWGADRFPNVTLTTHEGARVRFFDDLIKGKIVAINLIYTTCQYACPLETARLAQVQRLIGDRMGRDVFFYSITIDPDHDTPAVLADYARKYQAGPGWLFLTGSTTDIDQLSRKLGLSSPPDPGDPDGHMPYLLVGNQATGQWMRNSATDNAKFLARTIGDWLKPGAATGPTRLKSYAESPTVAFDVGLYTFNYHCAACHTIGGGTRIGPDLAGVSSRRDRGWLQRFIQEPDQLNAAGDPTAVALRAAYQQARMPNLDLSDADVSAVLDYMERKTRQIDTAVAPPTAAAAVAPPAIAAPPAVVDAYLRIQQALYADVTGTIGGDARTIETGAAALGASGDSLRSAAASLRDATDLNRARAAFAALSDALIAIVGASPASAGQLAIAFCPMAQKHWLQRGAQIENPFYGKAMPQCGRFVEKP